MAHAKHATRKEINEDITSGMRQSDRSRSGRTRDDLRQINGIPHHADAGRLSLFTLLPQEARHSHKALLLLLVGLLLIHRSAAGRGLCLGQVVILLRRAVEALVEDRLQVVDLKLGLEAGGVGSKAAAVRAAPSIGQVESLVDDLVAGISPIAHVSGSTYCDWNMASDKTRRLYDCDPDSSGISRVISVFGVKGMI